MTERSEYQEWTEAASLLLRNGYTAVGDHVERMASTGTYARAEADMLREIAEAEPGEWGEYEGWSDVDASEVAHTLADDATPIYHATCLAWIVIDPGEFEIDDPGVLDPKVDLEVGRLAQLGVYFRLYSAAYEAVEARIVQAEDNAAADGSEDAELEALGVFTAADLGGEG